jgi:hypothetical protein
MWVQVRQVIGTETLFTVTYPDSFNTFVVPLSATAWNANYGSARDLWLQLVGEPGLSSCTVQTQSDDGQNMRIDGFNVFLLGV